MKYINFLIVCLLVTIFQSCKITENLLIEEDGSGKFSYDIDASPIMEIAGSVFSEDKKSNKKKNRKKSSSTEKKAIDSVFTFKEIFAEKKDSIARLSPEEQERIRKLENFSVRILMNEEAKQMSYSLFSDFKTIEQLKDMTSPITTLKSSGVAPANTTTSMAPKEAQENSVTSYSYDGKLFKRIVSELEKQEIVVQNEDLEKELSEEEIEAQKLAEGMTKAMEELLGKSSYKVVYTFGKPIKKISIPNAVLSEDKKSVTIDYLFEDYMKKPKTLDVEIEFE